MIRKLFALLFILSTCSLYAGNNIVSAVAGEHDSEKNKEILVVVDDVLGQTHYSKVVITKKEGEQISAFDPYLRIKPGVYKITGSSDNSIYNLNLSIK